MKIFSIPKQVQHIYVQDWGGEVMWYSHCTKISLSYYIWYIKSRVMHFSCSFKQFTNIMKLITDDNFNTVYN